MYAPALRIWSLANPLMFLLLLPVLAAFMSAASGAAAVVAAAAAAADAAAAASAVADANAGVHPVHSRPMYFGASPHPPPTPQHRQRPPVATANANDLYRPHIVMTIDTDTVGGSGSGGGGGESHGQHQPATHIGLRRLRRRHRTAPHRVRRHALRHGVGDRWHMAGGQFAAQQPSQPASNSGGGFHHINPSNGGAAAADQNWWRSTASSSSSSSGEFVEGGADGRADVGNGDGGVPAQMAAGPSQQQAPHHHQFHQPHVTRHHHHQNYHLHKTLQPQQPQQLRHQSASYAAAPSSITMMRSSSQQQQQPPANLTTAAAAAVMPAFSAGASANAHFGRRPLPSSSSHHGHNSNAPRRRYCSARDVATLAFEAPTVFEGKVKSMSADRRHNFSVTFEVLATHKEQPQLVLPPLVRLQFEQRNSSGECDIYREQLRPRGFVRDLEPGRVYLLFVEQQRGDIGNFSILGRPVRRTQKTLNETLTGVRATYDVISRQHNASLIVPGERAKIESLFVQSSHTRDGRRVRIVCKVSGQPPPKVTWFKDGRSIGRNRSKYQFVYFRKRSELIIRSAVRNDSGKYECRAKNKVARQTVSRVEWVNVTNPEDPRETPQAGIGATCPSPVDNAFCLNGGTCVYFREVGEPACKCPDGFTGTRCETKNLTNQQASCGDEHDVHRLPHPVRPRY